jgi:major membrane immunogen (membrane-anchored lipoprotein)
MKKLTFVLISAAISLSACSSNRPASREYDDVYYSSSDAIADDYSRSNFVAIRITIVQTKILEAALPINMILKMKRIGHKQ